MPTSLVSRLGQRNELSDTRQELESANRRYERLVANLAKRGVTIDDLDSTAPAGPQPASEAASADDGLAEWEDWNRKFQSLLG